MGTSGVAPRRTSRAGAPRRLPGHGWWKTRQALERYDRAARYAPVVSIKAPTVDVDLRTEVANQIGVRLEMET